MSNESIAKDFDIDIISEFPGYDSSRDKTNIIKNMLVQGSQNVYKKRSGTISVRPGLKRNGAPDSTVSPISSEYVWNTSWGATIPVEVTNNTLRIKYNGTYYSLINNLTKTRYVFDKWFSSVEAKDRLIFVNGSDYIQHWSGGISEIASSTNDSGVVGQLDSIPTVSGTGYKVGDVLTITTGGTGATAEVLTLTNSTIASVAVGFSGGFGYIVGDIVTLPGVLFGGVNATARVTSIGAAGVVTGLVLHTTGGFYPGNDERVATGGHGGGLFVSFAVSNSGVASVKITNRGSGYTTGTGKVTTVLPTGGTGCTLNIQSIATGTITKTNQNVSWFKSGFTTFSGEKKININNSQYTYEGGETTGILYGISPNPTFEPAGSIAIQSVITENNKPSAGFSNDFIKIINQQLYIGSYKSRLCYISQDTDFKNFVVPTPRVAGSPELLTLDGALKGIGVRQGKAHIGFSTGRWAVISFSDITVGTTLTQKTTVDVKPVAHLQAPLAHEFIDNVGDTLIYLAQDKQVRTFGDFNNLFTPGFPSISQEIYDELQQENFTGGHLKCIGEDTYITAPNSGKVYFYQVRQVVDGNGNVVAQRFWNPPQIWNFTRIDDIDGVIYGYSNANPQVYQVWDTEQWYDDSPSGENIPYSCVAAFAYRNKDRRQGLLSFDKNWTEGYMYPGTNLNQTIKYDYQGFTAVSTDVVNSLSDQAEFFQSENAPSLGDANFGDESFGDGETILSQDLLPKFMRIVSCELTNCFEYQVIYSSDTVDSRWELLSTGTNARIDDREQANFLIKNNK